jgi:hypothetical protein
MEGKEEKEERCPRKQLLLVSCKRGSLNLNLNVDIQ